MNKLVKSNVLFTLLCEWNGCMSLFEKMDHYLSHVKEHLENYKATLPHMENVTKSEDSEFSCLWNDCVNEMNFTSNQDLVQHVYYHAFHQKLKCQGIALFKSESSNHFKCQLDSSSRNVIPDLPFKFVCCWENCKEEFDSPENFYDHVSRHADVYPSGNDIKGGCKCTWETCQTVVKSKHKLKNHLRSHTQEKLFACPTCGGLFANATKFLDHVRRQVESSSLTYRCSYCSKMFATKRFLRDHMRHHVNHYKCPFCQMTCPSPSSLRTHIRYRHSDYRPFSCHLCDFSAKIYIDLRRHLESHADRWILCDVDDCQYRCRFTWEMNHHIKNKHEGVEVAKYLCHICSQKYSRGSDLTKHLKKMHRLKEPSGHVRLRYKLHDDGFYRLQEFRYESSELQEQILDVTGKNSSDTGSGDDDQKVKENNMDKSFQNGNTSMSGEEEFNENECNESKVTEIWDENSMDL